MNAGAAPFVPGSGAGFDDGAGAYGQQQPSVFGQQQQLLYQQQPQQQQQQHGGGVSAVSSMAQAQGGAASYGGGWSGGGGGSAASSIEVFDSEVKAQLSLPVDNLFFTAGTAAALQQAARGGGKNKVCTSFVMHGGCRLGESCRDVHPAPAALEEARSRVYQWMATKEEEFTHQPEATYKVFYSDLKEVISVPAHALCFTRGLFLDPVDREKRPAHNPPHQRSGNPTIAQQAPTACGLFATNPAACKWGRFCNQAHVSADWIDNHRQQFEQWSSSLEAQFQALPEDSTFIVHDPLRRVLLRVPKNMIAEFTRGLLQSTTDKCPSVCLLSLQGRCTAARRCNQAHIQPVWLAEQNETGEAVVVQGTSTSRSSSEVPVGDAPAARQTSTASLGGFGAQPSAESVGSKPRPPPISAVLVNQAVPLAVVPVDPSVQAVLPVPVDEAGAADQTTSRVRPPEPMGSTPTGGAAPGQANVPPSPIQPRFSKRAEGGLGTPGLAATSTPPDAGQGARVPPSPIRPPGYSAPGRSDPQQQQQQGGLPPAFGGWGYFRTPDMGGMPADPSLHTPTSGNPRTPNTGSQRLSFSFPNMAPTTVSPLMRSSTNPAMRVSLTGFDEVLGYPPEAGGDLAALPPPAARPAPLDANVGASGSGVPPTPPGAGNPSSTPTTPLHSGKSPISRQAPRNPRYSPGGRPVATLGPPPPPPPVDA